ncbi:MAG: alpha-glucosidase, partial [Sphingorhabdus sp.]|nr:alpha-glucosidase [Sphingorhabdus sp.]
NPHIEMVRGNFAIDDNPVPMPTLTFADVSAHQVRLSQIADAPPAAILTLLGKPGAYTLEIETTDRACDRLTVSFVAVPDEHICGGGEQMSYLNLRGRAFPIWTSEPGVGRDKARELTQIMDAEGMAGGDYWTTNYPQPTFLSSRRYACHLNSSAYSILDFTDSARHDITVWEGRACFEFYTADSYLGLVSALSDRFGKQPALPDWAITGAIIGLKEGARSFERLDAIVAAGVQVSGLWCEDWVGIRQTSFGRRLFWNWDWNEARYPELPAKIAALGRQGIRFLGYVNPYLAVDGDQYAEAAKAGYLALRIDCDLPYIVDFGEFDCGIVDFTNPAASDWFADRIIGKEMLDFGLSGWMADFGEYLPTDLRLFDGRDPMLAHNQWPVLWAKVNADALAKRGKTGDALFFMRAGFSGVQQHCPLLWAGDQCVDFSRHDGIGTVITAALSAGMVGNAYSHSDIGGYTSLHGLIRSEALLMRWAELAAFTPVMRTHEGNRPDDNLQIDSNAALLHHFAAMTRVHAALVPYVKSLIAAAAETGLPLQRPLFLHYPDQSECFDCQDQYLYGPDLLVAPVTEENAMARPVILPRGDEWMHIWTGRIYAPGEHAIDAPIGSPPVFARMGSEFSDLFAELAAARGSISP